MQHTFEIVPYTPEDFAWTQWSPTDIANQAVAALSAAKEEREVILTISQADRNFFNTAHALERLFSGIIGIAQKIDLLMNVSPEASIREQAQQSKEQLDKAVVDYAYDMDLYNALMAYTAHNEQLEPDAAKLVTEMMRDYKRIGMGLAESERAVLQKNAKRLQELSNEFQVKINETVDRITLAPEETAGLPENFLSGLAKDEHGHYIVTTRYPEYLPFVKLADNGVKRKELVDKFFRKDGYDNIERLKEAVSLRANNARLLGYKNHVAFAAEVKTAKTEEVIHSFIDEVIAGLRPLHQKELDELTQFKRKSSGNAEAKVEYWEVAYLQNKLQKEKYGLDSELVKQYFPLQHVLASMLEVYSELLSLEFKPLQGYPTWYSDVQVYAMHDKQTGKLLSYFTLDLHPRDAKYSHAAEFPTITGVPVTLDSDNTKYIAPVASMVTNFPKSTEQNPSLMPHDQVETLFHEFGHVIHQNLSQTRFVSQSGTNVAGDFVEAPSQMLEFWVWDPSILKRITKHYKTGEAMPDALIEKLVASKNFGNAWFNMRQMVLGLFDYRLHTEPGADPVVLFAEVWRDLLKIDLPADQLYAAGFGHLMGGYEGNYYGYMWSQVYAADMFSRFAAEGILNPRTGMDYRQKVLAVGSSRDELDSIKDFLGREPNNKAFLKELGLQ